MTFVHRKINVYISSGGGQTGEGGAGTAQMVGLRVQAKITKAGADSAGNCTLAIYGMPLPLMNQLTRTGYQVAALKKSTVLVEAGDDVNGMSEVFTGTVMQAWPDMQGMPQVPFRIEATSGTFDGIKPAKPTSFKGRVPFDTVGQAIVKKFPTQRKWENNGIKAILTNPYFKGTALQQMRSLMRHVRAGWVDEDEKTIASWPKEKSRAGGVMLVSKETGMVADPDATPQGIMVKIEFSKPVVFGQLVRVQCIIDQANKTWRVDRIDYSLESETPRGEWFASLWCQLPGQGDTAQ